MQRPNTFLRRKHLAYARAETKTYPGRKMNRPIDHAHVSRDPCTPTFTNDGRTSLTRPSSRSYPSKRHDPNNEHCKQTTHDPPQCHHGANAPDFLARSSLHDVLRQQIDRPQLVVLAPYLPSTSVELVKLGEFVECGEDLGHDAVRPDLCLGSPIDRSCDSRRRRGLLRLTFPCPRREHTLHERCHDEERERESGGVSGNRDIMTHWHSGYITPAGYSETTGK